MELTQEQYERIADAFPKQRGNVTVSNLDALNGILYVLEHGCKWRALPSRFGKWYTVYKRMNRWSKTGVLDRVFERLAAEQLIDPQVLGLDSTSVKVHPDGHGAPTKEGTQAIGKSRGGWTTKIHMLASSARTAVDFCLSPGQDHDAPWGRELLRRAGPVPLRLPLVADRAYEGNETRQLALDLGYAPHIPPKTNRRDPWPYDRDIYKRRNEVERLFRRLKGYRRVYTRYDKLDVIFIAFITLALVHDWLRSVNTP